MDFLKLADKAISGESLADAAIQRLLAAEGEALSAMLAGARRIGAVAHGGRVSFCAIINAKSGRCPEDCAFCAQSSRHRTESPEYPLIATERVLEAAARMRERGVTRFGVVVSGKGLTGGDFDRAVEMVSRLGAIPGMAPDISPGILDADRLRRLQAAGLSGYHHNLETSRTFFPKICSTHGYDEDVAAVRAAVQAGLYVCSGGIFGLGESWEDRVELALTLKGLGVPSVPVNFLQPIPGTPCASRPVLTPAEALKIVALYRYLLPQAQIRICGGRAAVFPEGARLDVLNAGASGLMVGDYLTTKGADVAADRAGLAGLGLTLDESAPPGAS
jgi:biotin synthase